MQSGRIFALSACTICVGEKESVVTARELKKIAEERKRWREEGRGG